MNPKTIAALELVSVMRKTNVRGTTYIIAIDQVKMCKIGFTKFPNANGRIKELQKACPVDFQVLAEVPGGRELEQALHHIFSDLRVRDEWFRIEGPLEEFIEELSIKASQA